MHVSYLYAYKVYSRILCLCWKNEIMTESQSTKLLFRTLNCCVCSGSELCHLNLINEAHWDNDVLKMPMSSNTLYRCSWLHFLVKAISFELSDYEHLSCLTDEQVSHVWPFSSRSGTHDFHCYHRRQWNIRGIVRQSCPGVKRWGWKKENGGWSSIRDLKGGFKSYSKSVTETGC